MKKTITICAVACVALLAPTVSRCEEEDLLGIDRAFGEDLLQAQDQEGDSANVVKLEVAEPSGGLQ